MIPHKYSKSFSLGLQNGLEYRGDFFLGLISCVFPIIIQFFMWKNIYGNQSDAVIFGYEYSQMIAYSVLASIISRLTRAGFEYEINDDIKNGGLNKYIIRPISYFPYKLFSFLGQKTMHLVLLSVILAGVVLALNWYLGLTLSLLNLFLFLISLALAFILNFIIFFAVSLTGFWLTEIGFFFEAVRIVFIVFSGGIFPLDIFGGSFLQVLQYMPFKYTVNFPVDIINGRMSTGDAFMGLLIQMLWISVLFLVSGMIWKIGTRKYVAVGG